jgi:hypothetical protein
MIRLNIRTLKIMAIALLAGGVFAAWDLYVFNISSYLAGSLLVFMVLERRA